MSSGEEDGDGLAPATRIVRAGRDRSITGPFINPPVIHASTVLFENTDAMLDRRQRYVYGRRGTPTSEALESAVSEIEGAAGSVLCPSGLSAVSLALLAYVKAGDNVLMVDSVYGPVCRIHHALMWCLASRTIWRWKTTETISASAIY